MSETVKFKISPLVGAFAKPEVSSAHKLAGIGKVSAMGAVDHITLVYCLLRDGDPAVKKAATQAWRELPENVVLSYIDSRDSHPAIMDLLAKAHHSNPWIAQALLENPGLSAPARSFLLGRVNGEAAVEASPAADTSSSPTPQAPAAPEAAPVTPAESSVPLPPDETSAVESTDADIPDQVETVSEELLEDDCDGAGDSDGVDEPGENENEEPGEVDEDGDAFLSKYKIAMVMGIGEKIKMALTGDKEWRSILLKDANKLVSGSVIKNPRITDGEILAILKAGVQNDEIVRLILANKEWTKNYLIRKALIECPRTPLPNALRFLTTLNEKDVASYAKSKNISSVISTQAKRLLLAKKR